MRKLALVVHLSGLALLAGCSSYSLERPEQLYLTQSYLPLPVGYEPNDDIPIPAGSLGQVDSDCMDPAMVWRNPTGTARKAFQILPGMTLRVTETTYRRNEASGLPSVSEWQWILPRTGKCGSDIHWTRDDLLKVRHLLSVAIVKNTEDTPDVDYYLRTVRWAGCTSSDGSATSTSCSFDLVRSRFLEPFIENLAIHYRDYGLNYKQTEPYAPNDATATPLTGSKLVSWFGSVNAVRPADFFGYPTTGATAPMDIAELCSRLSSRRVAAPIYLENRQTTNVQQPIPPNEGHGFSTVDLPACNFTLKRLSLVRPILWPNTGGPVIPGAEVVLLTSGDPLLLFRPPAYANVLDSSSRRVCIPATSGDSSQECNEDQRLGQGFVDFDILIDVKVVDQSGSLRIPATMTIEQFEKLHANGRKVVALHRNTVWIPKRLLATKFGEMSQTSEVLDVIKYVQGRTLEIRFMNDNSEEWRRKGSIFVKDSLKNQVMFAPGDIVTLAR